MKSYDEIIIKYFDNQLSADERSAFEKELEVNSDLQSSFDEYKKVNDTFSKSDKVLVSQEYFNTIVPRFRQSLDKSVKVFPVRKVSFAVATVIVILFSYLIFQNYIFNPGEESNSIQVFTQNLTSDEIDELADYISDDSQALLNNGEKYQVLDNIDFSLEGIAANVSSEEKLQILTDYSINDIYNLVSDEEFENAYNEILSKRIF